MNPSAGAGKAGLASTHSVSDPRVLVHRPAAKGISVRNPKPRQRLQTALSSVPGPQSCSSLSATNRRPHGCQERGERSNRMCRPERKHCDLPRAPSERLILGNGYLGDGRSIRLDDLESSHQPDDPTNMASCIWRHDPRLRAKHLGSQQHESRVRHDGTVVFDCGHTSKPTRAPLRIPPVTWHHFDDTGFPIPYRHVCHDCDCHSRFMAQKAIIEVNQMPFKVLRMNQQIEELIESRKAGSSRNVEEDSDIAELKALVKKIVEDRDHQVWNIWQGWEALWGEKVYMNKLGYVYGPDPVVKGLEYVFPPEAHYSDNGTDASSRKR